MLALHDLQSRMASALRRGPDDEVIAMFAGATDRIVLGLRVHANTVAHSRIAALAATFPRLSARLGTAAFRALALDFIENDGTRGRPLTGIGRGLAEFIAARGADRVLIDLTRVEWLWLQSYHSAEARALTLGDIAALSEADLLALRVAPHPAARLTRIETDMSGPLALDHPGFAGAAAVLIARPDAEVRLFPASEGMAALFGSIVPATSIAAAFGGLLDQLDDSTLVAALTSLAGAGALIAHDESLA